MKLSSILTINLVREQLEELACGAETNTENKVYLALAETLRKVVVDDPLDADLNINDFH